MNVEPMPSLLCTLMLPPISSAICLEITRPSPEPPYFLVSEPSACENRINSLSMFFSEIPIPVSATAIRRLIFSFSASIAAIFTLTLPSDVNFNALESKQFKICWILCPSPFTSFGILLPNVQSRASPLFVAVGTCAATVSSMAARTSKISSFRLYLPASSLLISRISLIRRSRLSAQPFAVSRLSR